MGWFNDLTGIRTPNLVRNIDDSIRRGASSLDDKLNISELHQDAFNVLTLGTTGQFRKAEEAKDKAQAAAKSANQARMGANRAMNYRSMMKATEANQLSAAELMNVAASGGFVDSSAIQQSMSSAKAQTHETGQYYETLDTFGAAEAAASDRQYAAETSYSKRMTYAQMGLQVGMAIL